MYRFATALGLGLTLTAGQAFAEEKAHEHGHATLNVAVEERGVEMELTAPGADIVGFEHQPGSDADRAAITEAVATLQKGLFTFAPGAGCELEATGIYSALLPGGEPVHSGEHHHDDDHKDDHGHGHKHDHGHGHKHDDHKDEHAHGEKDDDHAHGEKDHDHKDDHAHGEKHDDDKHDDHAHGEKHDDHAHGDAEEHAEFRVHFHYECKDTAALTGFETSYFSTFPNAQELDVAAITGNGQVAAELTADNASIDF